MSDALGRYSQAGFIFQKKIFLHKVASLERPQEQATYEGSDDVSIGLDATQDEDMAIVGQNERRLVQVKLGSVNNTTMRRIVCNWMLAKHSHPFVGGHELIVAHGKTVDKSILGESGDQWSLFDLCGTLWNRGRFRVPLGADSHQLHSLCVRKMTLCHSRRYRILFRCGRNEQGA